MLYYKGRWPEAGHLLPVHYAIQQSRLPDSDTLSPDVQEYLLCLTTPVGTTISGLNGQSVFALPLCAFSIIFSVGYAEILLSSCTAHVILSLRLGRDVFFSCRPYDSIFFASLVHFLCWLQSCQS